MLSRRTAFVALGAAALSLVLTAGCDRAKPMIGEVPITGMTCESCVQALTHQLESVDGVERCEVSLEKELATVEYDGAQVKPTQLVEAVEAVGYGAGEPVVRPRS